MSRIRLKNGGKPRKKALLGTDGAIMAAATLTAAGMTTAATMLSANQQAKAAKEAANTQAESIRQQSENNTNLQKESIDFTRNQNQENRQQQQDIQATLQMLAGQENQNDRMEASKVALKYGGKPKRKKLRTQPLYGGANKPFKVIDGGGVIPIEIDQNGYGLYELFGNDHEHYHKAPGGKNKTGVGIKFPDGSVVEGEGNQKTNRGEKLYVTPTDAMFISKHSIDGFNPALAVDNGMNPEQAFNIQEYIKAIKGYTDDGRKKRSSLKKYFNGGNVALDSVANITQYPSNNTGNVANGIAYLINNPARSVAKNGKRISIKRPKAAFGQYGNYVPGFGTVTSYPNDMSYGLPEIVVTPQLTGNLHMSTPTPTPNGIIDTWSNKPQYPVNSNSFKSTKSSSSNPHTGAMWNAVGNLGGAALGIIGGTIASNKLNKAYSQAADTIANAYRSMTTIDEDIFSKEDYAAPHTLAVIRSANTNINPQLERIRRNTAAEMKEYRRNTLSSAAKQQRLAGANDRMFERMSEQYAAKHNADEAIKQANAQSITETARANADRDIQATKDYTAAKLALKQYNNDINNQKLAGIAGAYADAATNTAASTANAWQSGANMLASALSSSAKGFATSIDNQNKYNREFNLAMAGADFNSKTLALLGQDPTDNNAKQQAYTYYNAWHNSGNKVLAEYANLLANHYGFKS